MLRKVSWREYVKNREKKKVEELRDEIVDEILWNDCVKLTEREVTEFRYKKELYELLKKTEVEELRDEIEDEIMWNDCVKLTEREVTEFRYKKELYELLKKTEEEVADEYRIPDAYDQDGCVDQKKRFDVATQRFVERRSGRGITEQEAWEDHQAQKASVRFGAKDSDKYDPLSMVVSTSVTRGEGWRLIKLGRSEEE